MEIKTKYNLLDFVEDLFGNEYYIDRIYVSNDGVIRYQCVNETIEAKEFTEKELKSKNKIKLKN